MITHSSTAMWSSAAPTACNIEVMDHISNSANVGWMITQSQCFIPMMDVSASDSAKAGSGLGAVTSGNSHGEVE